MRNYVVFVSMGLLTLLTAIVVIAAVGDIRGRSSSPEGVVRGYFEALEAGNAADALWHLDPETRDQWSDFVTNGVLNEYRITGVAVRRHSLLDQWRGASSEAREATVFLDITHWTTGVRWQATPRVPLVQHPPGVWYLGRPPLAP